MVRVATERLRSSKLTSLIFPEGHRMVCGWVTEARRGRRMIIYLAKMQAKWVSTAPLAVTIPATCVAWWVTVEGGWLWIWLSVTRQPRSLLSTSKNPQLRQQEVVIGRLPASLHYVLSKVSAANPSGGAANSQRDIHQCQLQIRLKS